MISNEYQFSKLDSSSVIGVSLVHNRQDGIVSDHACAISQAIFLTTQPEVPSFSPFFRPLILEEPVLVAPARLHLRVRNGKVCAKADERNGVIGASYLGASTGPLPVIYNSGDIVFNTLVDFHWHGNHAVTGQLLEVSLGDVVVHFERIDLEELHRLFLVGARSFAIDVGILIRRSQSKVLRIVKSPNSSAADAAGIGEQVTVNQLLLRQARDFRLLEQVEVASI